MMSKRLVTAIAVVATAVVVAALMSSPAVTQTEPAPQDTVTVTAAGKVEGRPDLAAVSFGISARADSAQGAMNELSVEQNAVIDALLALGLPEEDVTTQNVSLQRDCHYDRSLDRTVCEGYVARTGVRAETRDLEQIGEIIDTGVGAGATSVRGISFERTEQNEAIREALAQAMDLAKMKAEVLATGAGRELGRAVVIEEGGARRPTFTTDTQGFASGGGSVLPNIVINPADEITKVKIVVTFALI